MEPKNIEYQHLRESIAMIQLDLQIRMSFAIGRSGRQTLWIHHFIWISISAHEANDVDVVHGVTCDEARRRHVVVHAVGVDDVSEVELKQNRVIYRLLH